MPALDAKTSPQTLFLIGLAFGISVWVASTYVLNSIGFPNAAAFPMAYTIALSVFGAFLYRIYKTILPAEAQRKPEKLQCIAIGAPTHGALQDAVNNWLAGGYGVIQRTELTSHREGLTLLIFFDAGKRTAATMGAGA